VAPSRPTKVILLFAIILGHPGANHFDILPAALTAYLGIFIAAGTLIRLNSDFLQRKQKELLAKLDTLEERIGGLVECRGVFWFIVLEMWISC
jgi:hypothetical protein